MKKSHFKFAFDDGIYYWSHNILTILILSIIVYVPAQICIEATSYVFTKYLNDLVTNNSNLVNNIYNFIRYVFFTILLMNIVFLIKNSNRKSKYKLGVKDALIFSLRKFPMSVLINFYAGFQVFIFTILLIIPGIWKGVQLVFVDYLWADKNFGPDEACDESKALLNKRWWNVFGFYFLILVIESIIEILIIVLFYDLFEKDNILFTFPIAVFINCLKSLFVVIRVKYYFSITKDKLL